jgi:hypothetical protein
VDTAVTVNKFLIDHNRHRGYTAHMRLVEGREGLLWRLWERRRMVDLFLILIGSSTRCFTRSAVLQAPFEAKLI